MDPSGYGSSKNKKRTNHREEKETQSPEKKKKPDHREEECDEWKVPEFFLKLIKTWEENKKDMKAKLTELWRNETEFTIPCPMNGIPMTFSVKNIRKDKVYFKQQTYFTKNNKIFPLTENTQTYNDVEYQYNSILLELNLIVLRHNNRNIDDKIMSRGYFSFLNS